MGSFRKSFQKSCLNREDLNITVVVDGCLSIGLQMERIDHIHIVEVCCSRFIRQIYRMLQRQIPDRECLNLAYPA